MDYRQESLKKHGEWLGKIEVVSRVPVTNRDELSLAYTPGVAQACLEIKDKPERVYDLTRKHNLCAVITNGTAVLGLGDIGGPAGMPVMEGKCVLFKELGGVDAFPLCVKTKDVDEFVNAVALIADSFGGINLEDIAAPACFEIEKKLKEKCSIPVFHDDQHGTAIVVLAGLINALKVVKKDKNVKICTVGAGAAGIAIVRLLLSYGFKNIVMCDKFGTLHVGQQGMNDFQKEMAQKTNPENIQGQLADAIKGADVFIGTSTKNVLNKEMVKTMNKDAIVIAMANPDPEIFPEEAKEAGVAIIATGRSDYPNQINNLLAFPGVFKGAFSVRAKDINEEMKMAAALAIAGMIPDEELNNENIILNPLDPRVVPVVAEAVAKTAIKCGLNQI